MPFRPMRSHFTHAAMVEPVSIAIHAVQRIRIAPTDTAVVVGAGMIGLFVIQALRWAGAQRIIAVDLAENRPGPGPGTRRQPTP